MTLVDKYLNSLYAAIEKYANDSEEASDLADIKAATGASDVDIARLKQIYPDCPQTLIELLKQVDGTYNYSKDPAIAVHVMASLDYEYDDN